VATVNRIRPGAGRKAQARVPGLEENLFGYSKNNLDWRGLSSIKSYTNKKSSNRVESSSIPLRVGLNNIP
jgi:hypothetical protein